MPLSFDMDTSRVPVPYNPPLFCLPLPAPLSNTLLLPAPYPAPLGSLRPFPSPLCSLHPFPSPLRSLHPYPAPLGSLHPFPHPFSVPSLLSPFPARVLFTERKFVLKTWKPVYQPDMAQEYNTSRWL